MEVPGGMGETKKQRSPLTTLCYIEKDDSYLMLHRIKKKQDVNEGKWRRRTF
jgi:hypothetical protein